MRAKAQSADAEHSTSNSVRNAVVQSSPGSAMRWHPPEHRVTGNQIIGLVCMALGALGVWHVIRAMLRRRALLRNAVSTKAEVIRLRLATVGDSNGPDWYVPTVRFTADGGDVEVDLDATRDEKSYAVGRKVRIQYQKGDSSNVVAADLVKVGSVGRWIALVLVLLVLVFGLLLLSGKYGFRFVPRV
jgi:hypothetical protein